MATIMGPTEVLVTSLPNDYPQPSTTLQWQTLQINQAIVSVTPSKPSATVFCQWPECQQKFTRKQELTRHTLSCHFPCSICCPHPSCSWRGTRKDELQKHMEKEKCGEEVKMDPELYKIFDAKWIFDYIYEDPIGTPVNFDPKVILSYIFGFVQERAMELRKTKLWGDPWGRQPKGRLG